MLPRRPRVSPATRSAFIKKYLASGLTQKEFCQQEKLAYPTFLAWLRKYRAASSQAPNFSPAAPSFVPLQLEASACLHPSHGRQARRTTSCALEFPNGVLVHFSGDIDAQLLTCLLRAAVDESSSRCLRVCDSTFPQATAMRKSFDGLSGIVTSALTRDPTSGEVYIPLNRRDRIKFSTNSFCLTIVRGAVAPGRMTFCKF